jgi:hypothetical protein
MLEERMIYAKQLATLNPPKPLKRETWKVCKDQELIYSKDLASDPDEHGGMGMHMAAAIRDKVITIPLHEGCSHVSIQVTDPYVASKIVSDGKVDVLAAGYWVDITRVKVVYHGTDVEIPRWGKTVMDTVVGVA